MRFKTYSDEVVKDLQVENKLSSQYTQLLASAKLTLLEKKERYHN